MTSLGQNDQIDSLKYHTRDRSLCMNNRDECAAPYWIWWSWHYILIDRRLLGAMPLMLLAQYVNITHSNNFAITITRIAVHDYKSLASVRVTTLDSMSNNRNNFICVMTIGYRIYLQRFDCIIFNLNCSVERLIYYRSRLLNGRKCDNMFSNKYLTSIHSMAL